MVQAAPQQTKPEKAIEVLTPPKPEEIEQMRQVIPFLEDKKAQKEALEIVKGYTSMNVICRD